MTDSTSGSSWADQLNAGQLAISRSIQMAGLTGRWSGSVFTWTKDGEEVAASEAHEALSDAFDEALARLPEQFKQ